MSRQKNKKVLLMLNPQEATKLMHAFEEGKLNKLNVLQVDIPHKYELPKNEIVRQDELLEFRRKSQRIDYVPKTQPKSYQAILIRSIFGILITFCLVMLIRDPFGPQNFIKNNSAIPDKTIERSASNIGILIVDSLHMAGVDHFKNEDFVNSQVAFERLYILTKDDYYRLFWGISLLKNGESIKAIEVFNQMKPKFTMRDQFQWHLILAYFELKDNDHLEEAICNYIANDYEYQISNVRRIQKKMKINCD